VKALAALAIVVAGAVAAFAVYAFGRDDTTAERAAPAHPRVLTLREGDVVRIPVTRTRCEVTQEGGIPNLFCTHMRRTRFQVVIWSDQADLYDLARRGEPMVPTYSVPATMRRAR
jgi:hypothetical protein